VGLDDILVTKRERIFES